jgi:hypothetical protein
MIDQKLMSEGFIKYLQQYYGLSRMEALRATKTGNTVKLPLFQEREKPEDELETMMQLSMDDPMMDAEMGMGMGMGGGMGMDAQTLNGLFAGPYDPMGPN